MAKNKNKKQKIEKKANKKKQKIEKKKANKKKQKLFEKKANKAPAVVEEYDSEDASDLELEPEKFQKLLEPYSKDQLIGFICDAAVKDSDLFKSIRSTADRDVSHRKIFVYGLGWDTTRESLVAAFQSFGEIEECRVVLDRATGKAKGFGFVIFKTRAGATKALKLPQKKINNRVTSCQLASIGRVPANQYVDSTGRKIYVNNVHSEADPEKLRTFFGKFGELEMGPLGFDFSTGKSRGYALFVYKTQEGAKKALEEPYKLFEGHQLHCQMASDNKNKAVVQPVQQQAPALAAVAAAQNMAMFNQHPSLNSMYPGLVAGSVNPLVAGALNPAVVPSSQVAGSSLGSAVGYGGYGASHGLGSFGASPSVYGAYASTAPALQGLQSYQTSHLGQSSSGGPHQAGALNGYPFYR